MKIFLKMLLGVLSTSVFLGGVGLICWRANVQVKSQVSELVLEQESTTKTLLKIEELLRKYECQIHRFILLKKTDINSPNIQPKVLDTLAVLKSINIKLNQLE